jgi:hypothetical protein
MKLNRACLKMRKSLCSKSTIVSASSSQEDNQGTIRERLRWNTVKYFLISAPVDWTPDALIRRFLLPTGEYVSCVLW